jgi:hypothetical protein
MLHLGAWWSRTSAARAHQQHAALARTTLPGRGLAACDAQCQRLELLNAGYLADVIALAVILHTSMLTPEQLAEAYLDSWPHLPTAGRVFDAAAAVWARRGA